MRRRGQIASSGEGVDDHRGGVNALIDTLAASGFDSLQPVIGHAVEAIDGADVRDEVGGALPRTSSSRGVKNRFRTNPT